MEETWQPYYSAEMNHPMDFTISETVLDLRKSKVKPEPEIVDTYVPVSPPRGYCPLTPPYYPTTIPVSYPQTIMQVKHVDSDDSSTSPTSVSSTYLMAHNVINAARAGKPTRPFKAYPKDPLSLSTAPNVILGQDSNDEYIEFRQRMLAQLESVSSKSNANMKRSISPQHPSSTGDMDDKTAAYWERRRKNNEAAKRSRDARRAKEDEIAIRAAFLEQENIKLKYELATLRNETAKLRCLVYTR